MLRSVIYMAIAALGFAVGKEYGDINYSYKISKRCEKLVEEENEKNEEEE